MTRTLATTLLAATLSATLGVATLNAQDKAVAKIPFAFHVRSTVMPAGSYQIGHVSSSSAALFSISDWNGHSLFVGAPDQGTADPDSSKLTFACYGSDCSLTKIELPGSTISYSLKPSSTHHVGMATMIAVRVAH